MKGLGSDNRGAMMYSVIDLFAGAGGLSLGFLQSGRFDIKVAYENNPAMQETYGRNHSGVDVRGDVCSADYKEIRDQYGDIDVVIGGPPCQGFSNANRQRTKAINQNNMLVKQFIRAIVELQPKAFVMENVSMLKSDVHRFYVSEKDREGLKKYSIKTKLSTIELLPKEAFFDEAKAIAKDENQINLYLWKDEQFNTLNIVYKASRNKDKIRRALQKHKNVLLKFSENDENESSYVIKQNNKARHAINDYFSEMIDEDDLVEGISRAVLIQRMLRTAKEIHDNRLVVSEWLQDEGLCVRIESYAVYEYLTAVLSSKEFGYSITDKVLCAADYGAPQRRRRYVVMGIKKTISNKIALPRPIYDEDQYKTVYDAISDLEDIPPVYDLEEDIQGIQLTEKNGLTDLQDMLRDSEILKNHIITRSTEVALERFRAIEEGYNFHSLDESLKTNTYTDVRRTQNTIYLRLRYDEPSGTVVNVRKSMWIHPKLDRAISIREAARLQTFPDSFVFYGTKDRQYQQVGNAVPPIMAKAIAIKLATLLDNGIKE